MACKHAHKMLDKAEDLTCEDCLLEIKVTEYERGLRDAHQKRTVTMTEIENAVGDTSDEYTEGVVELFEFKGFEVVKK